MANLFSYKTAALLVGISAVLHLVALLFVRSDELVSMLVTAVVIGLFALGLSREWRWLAYLAFVALLIGMVWAYILSHGEGSFPTWLHNVNAIANLGAAIVLFVLLWRPKTAGTE